MLDKSSVYDVLGEGMYFMDKCMFWIKVAHQVSTFWTFHCFSEVIRFSHVIFKTTSQFLYELCTIW